MNAKLTLKLDGTVIARAKKYAKKRNTSLSKMIEAYLDSITQPGDPGIETTPLVEGLSGVIDLPANYDYGKEFADYLDQKYT